MHALKKTLFYNPLTKTTPKNLLNFPYQPKNPLNFHPLYNISIFKPTYPIKTLPENLKIENNPNFDPKLVQNEFINPVSLLVAPGKEKIIGSWLLLTAAGVFFMIAVGGYTRLTNSGLSMTKWKPVQPTLPADDKEWAEEFEHYKQFPEFKEYNMHMDLEGFKKIYYVEWFHRLIGSSLGVVFGLPLSFFLYKGYLYKPMKNRLIALLLLGGSQGLIGWWMVKSGLKEKPDYLKKPSVSVYRLMFHLNTALLIYGGLVWNGLTLLRKPQEYLLKPENLKGNNRMRGIAILVLHFIALQTLTGSTVAGTQAGKVFNDWPFFNGELTPPKMWEKEPFWKNFFENQGTVQFNHRTFGYLAFISGVFMLYKGRGYNLRQNQVICLYLASLFIFLQVANGIATLKNNCKPKEANAHQINAVLVMTFTLLFLHSCRKPTKAYKQYLKQFESYNNFKKIKN